MGGRKARDVAAVAFVATILWANPTHAARADTVTIFAAASTNLVISAVNALYSEKGYGGARASFASSGSLAQQIVNGAPVDVFVSANTRWMDHVAELGAIVAESRVSLASNRLVLIVPAASSLELAAEPGFPLAERLGDGRLAIADPDHAPAGAYGKAALESLGLWQGVAGKLARTQDTRAAVALVERGEAAAGLAYSTDAKSNPRVRIAATFPASTHPQIRYEIAIVAGRDDGATRRYFALLTSPAAASILATHGFVALARPTP
ncbi:MAG: molybdate ABC transporter substrate-binding protein [Rhodospirillales bacterium]|jgi:molybdate transport system substrate-binding protein|nr:molybdate ABC transporter substrate-binding protein [Rhodospirillales bacterium]MDP6803776.1 molybdate ABC transporter substrate-binding protein [Rhodospirillales bacterium]